MVYYSITRSKDTKLPAKILYSVLNWGLGHASRSIPILKQILQLNIDIVIASDGEALLLLQKEFPKLTFETLISYNVQYSKNEKSFDKTIFLQLTKFGKAIKKEHQQTQLLIEKHGITHLISDNRYGCYSKKLPSTVVCHQINLQHKFLLVQKQMNVIHRKMLSNFNEIWVPDFLEDSIAGNITKKPKSSLILNRKFLTKIKYIGMLSRMKILKEKKLYDLCIILSGPEPQRTILEKILLKEVTENNFQTVLIRGTKNYKNKILNSANLSVYDFLKTFELTQIINQSKTVICRAGYSSIMDLIALKKQAILIPTPGQTEQEYLARFLKEKKWFYSVNQDVFKLRKALDFKQNFKPKESSNSVELLNKIVSEFILS